MPALALSTVALGEDVPAALQAVPPRGGVGQIVGPDGRNLLIGKAAIAFILMLLAQFFPQCRKAKQPMPAISPS